MFAIEVAVGSFDLTWDETWFDETMPWRYDEQWRYKICPDGRGYCQPSGTGWASFEVRLTCCGRYPS